MARDLGGLFSWWCPRGTFGNGLCLRVTLLSVLGGHFIG